jgi:hypothetical protein
MAESKHETQFQEVASVKDAQENKLLHLKNVNGVGIGKKESKGKDEGKLCIQVYVVEKMKKSELSSTDLVPPTIDGIVTDVVEIGVLEAHAFTARIRPAKPGYSIGHTQITAGTFGCVVRDSCYPCNYYILSNNHVLANSNAAAAGDAILQPGPHDGGTYPRDLIARLSRFEPIHFGSPARYNLVDAAIAAPIRSRDIVGSIANIGIPNGVTEATLGLDVIKSGRTTETTAGKVIGVDANVGVNYGASGVAYFRDQIITTNMSQGGDSGSLLLSRADQMATGLLFAGSSSVTIHNNITNVIMALKISIVTA